MASQPERWIQISRALSIGVRCGQPSPRRSPHSDRPASQDGQWAGFRRSFGMPGATRTLNHPDLRSGVMRHGVPPPSTESRPPWSLMKRQCMGDRHRPAHSCYRGTASDLPRGAGSGLCTGQAGRQPTPDAPSVSRVMRRAGGTGCPPPDRPAACRADRTGASPRGRFAHRSNAAEPGPTGSPIPR
jgi:hypothetical protein